MRSDKYKNNSELKKIFEGREKEIESFKQEYEGLDTSKSTFEQAAAKKELEQKSVGAPILKSSSGQPEMKDTTSFAASKVKEAEAKAKASANTDFKKPAPAKKINADYKESLKKDEELEKQKERYRAIVQEGNQNTKGESKKVNKAKAKEKKEYEGFVDNKKSVADFGEEIGNNKKKKPKRNKKKTALVIILCIIIIIAAVAGGVLLYFNSLTGKMDIVNTNPADFDIDSQVEKDLKNYENIAILGVDARKNEGYKGSRSDAIIIARIKKDTGSIQLISVMRDSYLQIEGENGQKDYDKITHAHAYGGGIDTCKSLNRNLDLNISEFLVFNWQAVADLVDAVGGVEVDIQSNEIYDLNQYGYESAENVGGTYTPIYNTGKQTLNGAQAVTYCRIRKNSGGDTGRGNRYKEVMEQLMKKASKMSPNKLNNIANKIFPEIQTNLKKRTMLSMLTKMGSYDIDKTYGWSKTYYGGIINGVWYSVPKTLETNVKWLHEKAFGQKDYKVTDKCKELSDGIIEDTGISGGEGITDTNE